MNFNIIVAAWGEGYVSCLCNIALPSLAFTEEDRSVTDAHRWTFLIYTLPEHRDAVERSLDRHFPTAERSFYEIRPGDFANHYLAMAQSHHHAAELCVRAGSKALIIAPDAVFSRGALGHVAKLAASGKRAIMTVGPRLRQATAFEPLRAALADGGLISSRALVTVLLEHCHPEVLRYSWTSDNFSSRPFMLLWDAPGGWLVRNFHLHPLLIDFASPTMRSVLQGDTIDGEFIGESIGIWDDIHVIQDSDDLLVCTLTPDDVFYSFPSPTPASVEMLRKVAYEDPIINPVHRWFLSKAVRIHSGDLDEAWRDLEEGTGHLAYAILSNRGAPPTAIEAERTDLVPRAPSLMQAHRQKPRIHGQALARLWGRLRGSR